MSRYSALSFASKPRLAHFSAALNCALASCVAEARRTVAGESSACTRSGRSRSGCGSAHLSWRAAGLPTLPALRPKFVALCGAETKRVISCEVWTYAGHAANGGLACFRMLFYLFWRVLQNDTSNRHKVLQCVASCSAHLDHLPPALCRSCADLGRARRPRRGCRPRSAGSGPPRAAGAASRASRASRAPRGVGNRMQTSRKVPLAGPKS